MSKIIVKATIKGSFTGSFEVRAGSRKAAESIVKQIHRQYFGSAVFTLITTKKI